MPHVLILGAAGRLGRVLSLAFAQAGWRVQAVLRGATPPEFTGQAGIEPLRLDALDSAGITRAAAGASVLVNALNAPYDRWDELALPLARSAQRVATALGALLMLPGNVYNFGSTLPELLAPDTPEQGDTPHGSLRIAMEGELAQAAGLDSVVIRAGDYFGGPGTGSWFDLAVLSQLARAGWSTPAPRTACTPGPICPTWRAPSWPSRGSARVFRVRATIVCTSRGTPSPASSWPRHSAASAGGH